jgi:hypothetical protein
MMASMADRRLPVFVVLLLWGCNAVASPAPPTGGGSLPPGSSVSAPTASTSPDPETLRKAAGVAYLAAANASQKAQKALSRKYPARMTLAQTRALLAAQAKIDGTFVAALKKLQVPPDTAGDLHTAIVRWNALQAIEILQSRLRSFAELNDQYHAFTNARDAASAASNQLRSDLNLSPI